MARARGIDARGVGWSRVTLPQGPWQTVLQFLCERFGNVAPAEWMARMSAGEVLDAGDGSGSALSGGAFDAPIAGHAAMLRTDAKFRPGMVVCYRRAVDEEVPIPFEATVLFADDDLVVVDKPHFLPVVPAGGHVTQTVLARLALQFDSDALVPLHRIDRDTAGLVLFSRRVETRAVYQALFRERRIAKRYLAVAGPLPGLEFPIDRRTRIVAGTPFFRMQEIEGVANAHTRIEVLRADGAHWQYALRPTDGRKHQLRVQMAGLGAGIVNDVLYPALRSARAAHVDASGLPDPSRFDAPLQLLAQALSFDDPITGQRCIFESRQRLAHWIAP